MDKKRLITILAVIIIIIIAFFLIAGSKEKPTVITTTAQRGTFEILVYSTGQLSSENTDNITAPEQLANYNMTGISSLTITDLVEEGTYVDSGDYIATLDNQAVEERLADELDNLTQMLTDYEDSKIDSNLTLSNQRDQIMNAELEVEERRIAVTESAYESPSVKRKVEMDLDKAERKLNQVKEAYKLVVKQEGNKVDRRYLSIKQLQQRVDAIKELRANLIINSPKSGIITYYQYPSGGYVQTGSGVSRYSNIIATFPNMNKWVTKTYINEIDISLIKPGQKVKIGIDAFPDKELNGEVVEVANMGLTVPQSDAKAFEVKIKILDSDEEIKPGMTTSNIIQVGRFEDVVYIPIESVFKNDSLSYVYLASNEMKKQVIETGDENENFVIVYQGITEGQELHLSEPENAEDFEFVGMEIYADILRKQEQENMEKNLAKSKNLKNPDQETGDIIQTTETGI